MTDASAPAARPPWATALEPAPLAPLVRLPSYPWLVVAIACTGAFIGQLDASIVQLALPSLERAFDARLGLVSWVAIAYQLAFAASLPVFARLADMGARKLLYLAGFALFAAASVLCALAPDLPTLIAARGLLGVGGAMLGANSIVILLRAAGPDRRGAAMGAFTAAQAVGVSLGPLAGGVLLEAFGWCAVFWASVPFGLAAALAVWLLVPKSGDGRREPFDLRGALLLVPALAALLLAVSQSYHWGLGSPAFLACAAAAAVLLAGFVAREGRAAAPLIDLALFRAPAFAGGMIATIMAYAILYGFFFLMAFTLARGFHDTPVAAGLRLAIVPVAIGLAAPFSGRLAERIGLRRSLLGAMVLVGAALGLLVVAFASPTPNRIAAMAAFAMFGAGLGLFIAPNSNATLRAAPDERGGAAGGLLNLMRMLGSSLGVAGLSALMAWSVAEGAGGGGTTLGVDRETLFAAVREALGLLIAFAAAAAAASRLHRAPATRPVAAGGGPAEAAR